MKIKAFSFERDSFSLAEIKRSVTDNIEGAGIYFESFSDGKKFFEATQAALKENDTVLLGIEGSLFLKFKPILIKAFNLTPSYSRNIYDKLPKSLNDEKLRKAHMLMPNEATELLTEDGLYSGFHVDLDGKLLVVLPLKTNLSAKLIKNSELPFVKKKTIVVASVNEAPVDNILEKAKVIVEKLNEHDLTIAIPTTPAALTLQDKLNSLEGGDRVIFTPFVSDKGISDPKEYSAELARGAKELKNSDIGATISTIFREKKGDVTLSYYAFIGVAIEDKVVVRKLIASADESVPNLVKEASVELYNLIDKYIDEYVFKLNAPEEEKFKYETAQIEAEVATEMRPTATLSRQGTMVAIAVLVLAVLVCAAVGFKFSGIQTDSDDEPETEALQQIQTTGVEVTPDTTKDNKKPTEESTTAPESTTNEANNFTEPRPVLPETTTSIFEVDVNNVPTTTRPAPRPPRPTTTRPPIEEEPVMPDETEKPTEEKTTAPKPSVSFVVGEMS